MWGGPGGATTAVGGDGGGRSFSPLSLPEADALLVPRAPPPLGRREDGAETASCWAAGVDGDKAVMCGSPGGAETAVRGCGGGRLVLPLLLPEADAASGATRNPAAGAPGGWGWRRPAAERRLTAPLTGRRRRPATRRWCAAALAGRRRPWVAAWGGGASRPSPCPKWTPPPVPREPPVLAPSRRWWCRPVAGRRLKAPPTGWLRRTAAMFWRCVGPAGRWHRTVTSRWPVPAQAVPVAVDVDEAVASGHCGWVATAAGDGKAAEAPASEGGAYRVDCWCYLWAVRTG